MLGFIYTTVRFLWAVWSRTWRSIFRSKRSFAITASAALLLGCVWIGASSVPDTTTTATAKEQRPKAEKSDGYTTVTAAPIEAGKAGEPSSTPTKTPPPMGANKQAVDESGPKPSYEPQSIPPPPKKVEADRDDPKSVATAWAKNYLSRGKNGDQWQERIKPLTVSDLHDYLTSEDAAKKLPTAEKPPTHVSNVEVKAAETDVSDTPIRWSRNLVVDVKAAEGSTTTLTYSVSLSRSEKGWKLTDATQEYWNVQPSSS